MKDRSDMIGNGTRDLPACSAVSESVASLRTIFLFCPAVFAVSYFVPLWHSVRVVSCWFIFIFYFFVSVTTTEYINELYCLVNHKCLSSEFHIGLQMYFYRYSRRACVIFLNLVAMAFTL